MCLSDVMRQQSEVKVGTIEISVKGGEWFGVPALYVDDKAIIVKGMWVKKAVVHAEEWLETELEFVLRP